MLPFLSDAFVEMFTCLMSMVIKRNVLNDATTTLKLVKIDMTDKESQLDAMSIKLGTALKEMLSALGAKLQERSPLQYTVVRMASSLSPHFL